MFFFSNFHSEVNPDVIRWVITLPAIWSDAAKQFMREAALIVSTAVLVTKRLTSVTQWLKGKLPE